MLIFFLLTTIAVVVGLIAIYWYKNQPEPALARSEERNRYHLQQFKEEFAMEQNTESLVEKVANQKIDEEIAEELIPLKNNLNTFQSALDQLQKVTQQKTTQAFPIYQNQEANQLLLEIQQLSTQAKQQQQKTFQHLQTSIHQVTQLLYNTEQLLQTFQLLNEMTAQINQSLQILQQQNNHQLSSSLNYQQSQISKSNYLS